MPESEKTVKQPLEQDKSIKENDRNESVEKLIAQIPELARAHEYGIDIAQLIANKNRSPAERIRRHAIALDMFKKLYNKGKT
ncbi:MAG: hypothetical protein JW860_05365 [Sedimentisphaerales bacterium]|nr:hypothetical protein [Sedimentisphaerales bacterium]